MTSNHVEEGKPAKQSLANRISRFIWDKYVFLINDNLIFLLRIFPGDDKSEEEREFVRRLDLGLITIAWLGYFIKYLDQTNISSAYVSGMKEDLNIQGNEYNLLLTMFTVGYVIGQYPGTLLMVKVKPSIWLPCCEIFWTILVMCCTVAPNVQTLYALRFLIRLAEASAYPGMLWVLGSWYGPSELGKRAVLFICSSSAGTMFSGYLQAGVHKSLQGVHGYTGWQWLFIVDGMISFLGSFAYMNLWLKNTGKYSTAEVNVIPTGGYGLQIVMALIYSWTSDATESRWPVIAFGAILPLIGNIILSIWPASDAAKFAGFYLNFTVTGCGALTLSWASELTSYNAEYRAMTIGFLNTASYVFNAWVPNLIFPASRAPNYSSGYKVTSVFFAVFFLGTLTNAYLAKHHRSSITHAKRQERLQQHAVEEEAHTDSATSTKVV
ncbi:major facilitator superfamily transporter [Moniliophthora roreri]|nr:major facilitator superfamily transporter [Moniliophthora roreri]